MTAAPQPAGSSGALVAAPLAVIAALTVFVSSTDLYLATMPAVAEALAAPPALVQLTLSLNLAAYAAATLLHGPLADRFGRRRVLAAGLAAFVAASLACALAPGIGWLLAGRVAQGLAASTGTVLTALVLRELFDEVRARQWLAVMAIASAAGSATAPLLGSLVADAFGWRANFSLLAGAGAAVFVLVLLALPETGVPRPGALRPATVAARYRSVLANRTFMRFQLVNALSLAALFAFMTAAPFVFVRTFGLAPAAYALLHGGLVVVYVVAAATSARLAARASPHALVVAGLAAGAAGVVALAGSALAPSPPLAGILAGMAFNAVAIGLIMSNAWLLLLDAVPADEMGSASAFAGFTQMLSGALASGLVAALPAGSVGAMALVIGLCGAGTVAAFLALGPRTAKGAAAWRRED